MTIEVGLLREVFVAHAAGDGHDSKGFGGCTLNKIGEEAVGTADG